VSRVGGSAQIKAMKQVAGTLRLDLAQYRELAAFAQFGSDLDQATQRQLARGQRLVEILKQPQYRPMDVEQQVLILWAATTGQLDEIPVDQVRRFEADFQRFVETSQPGILNAIREKKALTDEIKADLEQVISDFKASWQERALNPQPLPPGPDPEAVETTADAGA
jgi:F-type H+-transporting ATPase subunit alpha